MTVPRLLIKDLGQEIDGRISALLGQELEILALAQQLGHFAGRVIQVAKVTGAGRALADAGR
jgi:hypothetical protein